MLELQKFIIENPNDFREKLAEKPYSIKIVEDNYHILFKYNQIESDFNLKLVRECRGIILYKDDYSVASRRFEKFGNFGESYVPDIDWGSASVQEKIDGSLLVRWYSRALNLWMVSTNGTIDAHDADLNYPNFSSFADLFWYTIDNAMGKYDSLSNLDEDKTYLMELATPANRIIVPHKEFMLYHLATKVNETGEEVEVDLGLPKPKRYPLRSIDDCVEASKALPFNDEGYVVVDKYLNRNKIKSPAYLRVHRLRGEGVLTNRRVLDMIRENEQDEYLAYYPEDREAFESMEESLNVFFSRILGDLVLLEEKKDFFENRKEAAFWIKEHTIYPAVCFALLDGQVTSGNFESWFMEFNNDKLLKIIGVGI